MSELVGYARVSSRDQKLDSQIDMLKQTGCTKIFADKTSGVSESRPEWDKLLDYIRPGDIVVMVELSRMTRSLTHLLQLAKEFDEKGINIKSLRESIDTASATGRAFFLLMGVINQLERELKAERAAAGRSAARARGRTGGRPKTDSKKLEQALILYKNSDYSADNVCQTTGVGRRTFFRYLSQMREADLKAKKQLPPDVRDDTILLPNPKNVKIKSHRPTYPIAKPESNRNPKNLSYIPKRGIEQK